jgi:hypothetical protein
MATKKLTTEQLKHLDQAFRLAREAEKEFREVGLPISTGSVMQISQALGLARDLLGTLTQETRRSV